MSESFTTVMGERRGRAVVMRARGRLDARTSPLLLQRAEQARPAGGHLVLNLAEVSFLSSAGVGALMVLAEKARQDGGSLRLAPVSAAARSVLGVLNLDRFLTIDGSEDEAISALEAA